MLQPKTKLAKGFTIIEVLIVLAIAGLIMVIVFLAVPQLQRNARNTQMKNAASSILGAVSEFENNNNGAMPTQIQIQTDGTVTVTAPGIAGSTPATAKVQGGYTATAGTAMPSATGTFVYDANHKCNGNAFSTTTTNRAFSLGFLVETGSGTGTAPQCVES